MSYKQSHPECSEGPQAVKDLNKKGLPLRSPFAVPSAGVEPAQLALLVFETSASTNSASWAF